MPCATNNHTCVSCSFDQRFTVGHDFALSQNCWPVKYTDAEGDEVDLTLRYIVALWTKYTSLMVRVYMYNCHTCVSIT